MWDIKGVKSLKRLLEQDIQVTRNRRVLTESLSKGKLSITIVLTYYSFRQFVTAGLPIKPLPTFKEGTYISQGSGNLAIIKNPPHPNATKFFVNWLLGKEGQEVFTNAMGQPTRRLDVDTSFARKIGYLAAEDGISVEDYKKFENQSEEKLLKVRLRRENLPKSS